MLEPGRLAVEQLAVEQREDAHRKLVRPVLGVAAHRDHAVAVGESPVDRDPRQVSRHGCVEVDLVFLDELEHKGGRKLLGHRPDAEPRVGRVRDSPLDVRQPDSATVEDATAVGDDHGPVEAAGFVSGADERLDLGGNGVGGIIELVNGRISKFTIDYLINMCSHAGIEVDISFGGAHAGSEE